MPGPFRFTMHPRDDLSSRPDFAYDLMQDLAKEAKAIIEGCGELAELRGKADIRVDVKGTLRNVLIDVKVVPKEGIAVEEAELIEARKAAGAALDGGLKERMGEILQGAIDSARGRM